MRSPQDPQDLLEHVNTAAAEFESANAGVEVEVEFVDWDQGRERIQDAVDAGNPPDLSVVGVRWVPEFVAAGYIEPLDRYMSRTFRRQFIPAVIDQATYQGRTFGLPVSASSRALFYNKDIFEQAGLEAPPATWDELLAAGQAINALDESFYGFGLQAGNGIETNTYFYYFLWGNGGRLYNASFTASTLDEPTAIEALTFMKRLVDEGATQANVLDYDRRSELERDFVLGRAGMIISGSWLAGLLNRSFPNLNYGVAPIPFNTEPVSYAVIDALVMFKTSPNKELAWEMLQFLFEEERRLDYVTITNVLPTLRNVAEDPEFLAAPENEVLLELLVDAEFEPLHTESERIAQTVIDAVTAVHQGDAQPEEALTQAADRINELLETTSAGW